jgi:hypothetical protein
MSELQPEMYDSYSSDLAANPIKGTPQKDNMAKLIIGQYPPNYEAICKRIPYVKKHPAIIFTYGDTIYSPKVAMLRPDLLAHEGVHVERQSDPVEWWNKYLADPAFRLQEELAAYRVQYQYAVKHYNRKIRRQLLSAIAGDISSPMYGNIITKERAIELITEEEAI